VGYRRAEIPEPWRAIEGSKVSFPEVFDFQREVTAMLYERQGNGTESRTGTNR
jgi:hypothetical protein